MASLAAYVVRYRWWVIGAWVVVFLASAAFAPRVTGPLKQGFGEVDTESRLAVRQMVDALDVSESGVTLVFSSDTLQVSDPAYIAAMEDAIAPLREIPEVARVVTFYSVQSQARGAALGETMVASDGRTTYAFVELDASIDESTTLVEPIRDALADTELDVWVTGGVALFADLTAYSEADLRRAELITIPLLAIALLIVFGGVVAAGLPVAMGLLSVSITLSLVFMMAQVTDMSVLTLNIASFLGLGMAVDYSLLMVTRFREEIGNAAADAGHSAAVAQAISTTMQTSGKAIAFSAGTSVIALSGLLFFDFMMLRSLGVGGIVVIVFSMFIALTLLPALFAVLGRRVDALSIWRRRREDGERGFWFVLSRWVMRHPFAVIVPVVAVLLLLGAPFLDVKLGASWSSMLPEGAESRQGDEIVAERFGPSELAHIVLVETSPASTLSPENVAANLAFIARMDADPRVARVESVLGADPTATAARMAALMASGGLANDGAGILSDTERAALGSMLSDDMRTQVVRVVPAHPPMSDETKALLADIRAAHPGTLGGDMTVRVTGITADLEDTIERMYGDFPMVILYVMVVTYLALFFLLRSALLPLKAVILNALSILAGFGALVFIFQQGNFQNLLGFTAGGFTEATAPILIFSVVFGLSMDYEVFLLSRVKEDYEKTGDNTRAVAVGMQRSGRVITSAAAILILVSLGFATGDLLLIKAIGVGTAIAVLIDATIVRALLVPALMRVMSGANWWAPRRLGGGTRAAPSQYGG